MPPEPPGARGAATPAEPHTAAELDVLTGLLPRGASVVIGHGRDGASTAAARAFAARWQADGGTVLDVVDWPEEAASWLRQARRFTAPAPDAWVVAAGPRGWAGMSRRLRQSTSWDPARTVGFASTGSPLAVALAGPGTLDGLRGATADGRTWQIGGDGDGDGDGPTGPPPPTATHRARTNSSNPTASTSPTGP
ncbi:hypothetical protein ABTX81_00975 [Kitasatospora sp. NPDC097605]|uniref:hypothetical protein n=1 Tax=Kitasatospora sp. NPDC097605 TaxID=3157226 RepID=UPI0033167AEF